jgi:hypothetical protein
MGTAQVAFQEELWGGATGSDVSHMTRSMFSARPDFSPYIFSALFFGFPRFLLTIVVVQVLWLPEVTQGNPKEFPWMCACATGSCAISVLVGSFHRKWRHQTSRDLFGVPLEGWCARMRNLKLRNIRSKVPLWCSLRRSCLSFSTPFTGYLPLSRHFHGEHLQ